MRWTGRRATSARTSGARRRRDDSSRRTKALMVPMPDGAAGPVERRLLVGHPVDDEVDEVLVGAQRRAVDRPRAVVAHRLAVARQLGGDVVHHHRVLLALVLGVGEHERQQLARRRTPRASSRRRATPPRRLDTSGPAFGSLAAGRGVDGDAGERLGRQPEALVALPIVVGEADVRLVEEEEVLALHVEDEGLGVGRLGAEHARAEQAVEQERGVARLGGDARDARDVDVGAAGAVEELEVGVERLAVAAEPDRAAWPPCGRSSRAVSRSAPTARRTGVPGSGGTYVSGSMRVVITSAASKVWAGSSAVGDEEHVGAEAGALVDGPDLGDHARQADDLAVGHRRGR